MPEGSITVRIPKNLYEKIRKQIESDGEFKSVDEYVTFVLEELLKEDMSEEIYSPEEEEEIKKRLRSLGYM